MTDKIQKHVDPEPPQWGEDLHAIWEQNKNTGKQISRQVGEKIFRDYLTAIRKALEEDSTAREVAAEAKPAISAKAKLIDYLMFRIARTETSDLFEKAVEYILLELDRIREKGENSLYLVDGETGRNLIPMGPNSIYQPPDFIGEDGKVHKARPIVHPGISSSLALAHAQAHRMESLRIKAEIDPDSRLALQHVLTPDSILKAATIRLEALGVVIGDVLNGEEEEIRFGHEHVENVHQSLNPRFHRSALLSEILTRRIFEKFGVGSRIEFLSVKQDGNNKRKWHVVRILVEKPHLLES